MNATDDFTNNPRIPASTDPVPAVPPGGAPSRPESTGLSDLAVSPFGMPTSLLCGEVRVAWLGRTSTHERQDPRQSLIRQLDRCRCAIPAAWVIVCHFYDVESGRLELDQRGQGTGYDRFDIPIARDGGIADLLDEAGRPGRRFDVVICESTSRVARRMYEGLSVERELDKAGVPLFAWNEPIKLDGGRAQQILQRRINQAVAEYEVLNTLEQSWGGLCTHVREGWNIGKPPYGYKGKSYRHPNPMKADKGLTKTRLEPDGVRGATVTQIASWRFHEGLGYGTIADRLNADLGTYPPPEPPGGSRARGAWGKSSVAEILRNPKYTGYQVFNRRASRSRNGKVNAPALWVWSPELVHEPLIPKRMFDEMATTRQTLRGSRHGGTTNGHPAATRTYVLRGMVFCACGRRMFGNQRRNHVYYTCWPRNNNRGLPDPHPSGAKTVYVREDAVLEAVSALLADQLLRLDLQEMLTTGLGRADDNTAGPLIVEREQWLGRHADLDRQQHNILRQARDGAPDEPFSTALRGSYNELEIEKTSAAAAIMRLDATINAAQTDPPDDTSLPALIPDLRSVLANAPQQLLRRLFEITQLTIRLHNGNGRATIRIRLPSPA